MKQTEISDRGLVRLLPATYHKPPSLRGLVDTDDEMEILAEIEGLPITTDEVARVVVDERTGTVVIGEKVRISKVAISHGSLTVRVTETPMVVQPEPFSDGVTAFEPNTDIAVNQQNAKIGILTGANLENLVKGLNQIGVKPTGIIAILQAIKTSGALHAELVVQ